MEVDVNVRRVVDVKIQALTVTEKDTKSMPYGFADTNPQLIEQQNKSKNCCQKFVRPALNTKTLFLALPRRLKKPKITKCSRKCHYSSISTKQSDSFWQHLKNVKEKNSQS